MALPGPRVVALRAARAGGVFAVAGLLASLGFVLQSESPGESLRLLAAPVAVASFGVGALCWTMLCLPTSTYPRAALAGLLFGLATHVPAMLLLMLTVGRIAGMQQGPEVGGILGATLFFAFFSLLTFGWLSVALGIAAGFALTRWEARR
jgi:hypothetical protein